MSFLLDSRTPEFRVLAAIFHRVVSSRIPQIPLPQYYYCYRFTAQAQDSGIDPATDRSSLGARLAVVSVFYEWLRTDHRDPNSSGGVDLRDAFAAVGFTHTAL